MSDQNLAPCDAAPAVEKPYAELQLPPPRRSRKKHDLSRLSRLRRNPAGDEGRGRSSMNRHVVVGSNLASANLRLQLHAVLLAFLNSPTSTER